jgi:mannose-6-phosphate isomerase-like protein (cupin superfamily)
MEAGPGDMLVVEAGTAHKFTNLGPEALDLVCIHAAPKMVQEDLE